MSTPPPWGQEPEPEPPATPPPPPHRRRRTSPTARRRRRTAPSSRRSRPTALAIASLIVSIGSVVFCCGLPAIVGAILGHVARKQIREQGQAGEGIALGGIIVGWIAFGLSMALLILYVVLVVILGVWADRSTTATTTTTAPTSAADPGPAPATAPRADRAESDGDHAGAGEQGDLLARERDRPGRGVAAVDGHAREHHGPPGLALGEQGEAAEGDLADAEHPGHEAHLRVVVRRQPEQLRGDGGGGDRADADGDAAEGEAEHRVHAGRLEHLPRARTSSATARSPA